MDSGGRDLLSCSNWENHFCDYPVNWNYCACMSCRTGNAYVKNYQGKQARATVNPYDGAVSHDLSYWNGNYWEIVAEHQVGEGYLGELWGYGPVSYYWWADLYDASGDNWNWFVFFYDHRSPPVSNQCYNIY